MAQAVAPNSLSRVIVLLVVRLAAIIPLRAVRRWWWGMGKRQKGVGQERKASKILGGERKRGFYCIFLIEIVYTKLKKFLTKVPTAGSLGC